MSASDIEVLADLPSRETLLAQFAGALSAPLQQLAGLVQALPRNLAYGLSALLEQRQSEAPAAEAPAGPATDEAADGVQAESAPTETAEAPAEETAPEAPVEGADDAPAAG
jgi:large subunit ribosomal protein L10